MSTLAKIKHVFDQYPGHFILGAILIAMVPFGTDTLGTRHRRSPCYARHNYTVWRHDDPRTLKMYRLIKRYNWKPPVKPDLVKKESYFWSK